MRLPVGHLYTQDNPTGAWTTRRVHRHVDAALPVALDGCPAGTLIRWHEEVDTAGHQRRTAVSFLNPERPQ